MQIKKEYYLTEDVLFLAKDLIGKVLHITQPHNHLRGMIVEAEAYRAPEDRASHAFGNRMTARNRTMFLEGGHAYVYICYGIHDMLNVVTGPEGLPHAVLIRAIQPLEGIEFMATKRNRKSSDPAIGKGPGCVTQALGINKIHDALKLYQPDSPVQLHDEGIQFNSNEIGISPRIGVESSGESALLPYRFFLRNHPSVSGHIRR